MAIYSQSLYPRKLSGEIPKMFSGIAGAYPNIQFRLSSQLGVQGQLKEMDSILWSYMVMPLRRITKNLNIQIFEWYFHFVETNSCGVSHLSSNCAGFSVVCWYWSCRQLEMKRRISLALDLKLICSAGLLCVNEQITYKYLAKTLLRRESDQVPRS